MIRGAPVSFVGAILIVAAVSYFGVERIHAEKDDIQRATIEILKTRLDGQPAAAKAPASPLNAPTATPPVIPEQSFHPLTKESVHNLTNEELRTELYKLSVALNALFAAHNKNAIDATYDKNTTEQAKAVAVVDLDLRMSREFRESYRAYVFDLYDEALSRLNRKRREWITNDLNKPGIIRSGSIVGTAEELKTTAQDLP